MTATTYSAISEWASQEFSGNAFNDQRLTKRCALILSQMMHRPDAGFTQTFEQASQLKGAYRFMDNDSVTADRIIATHAKRTVQRCREATAHEELLLVAQDTTEADYSGLKGTEDLGRTRSSNQRGILVHSCMAISSTGVPLGLLDQYQWTRPLQQEPIASSRRQRPTSEKESQRWIDALGRVEARLAPALGDGLRALVIADREADIYDLFACKRHAQVDLLIRVAHDRRVAGEHRLLRSAIEAADVLGRLNVSIERSGDREARLVECRVRATRVDIIPPHRRSGQPISLTVINLDQIDPAGTPLNWTLTTTLPIESFEDAERLIGYYLKRWLIERFHYTLKSGCAIEDLQLEHVDRLKNAIALYSIIAWRLLWLTYNARQTPQAPCSQILSGEETELLIAYQRKRRGTKIEAPPTIAQAVTWIAQLGGYQARKSDPPPGVKVLWLGIRALDEMLRGWDLAKASIH